jgi:mRNA-degrading endonuclease RelE of RelBE toxin-antitoxin system
MKFTIKFTEKFMEQLSVLDVQQKQKINEKIELIKQNPFRFKKIHSAKFNRVFRVRFELEKKEMRLIYVLLNVEIVIVCLLERNKDYKDLELYLSMVN